MVVVVVVVVDDVRVLNEVLRGVLNLVYVYTKIVIWYTTGLWRWYTFCTLKLSLYINI